MVLFLRTWIICVCMCVLNYFTVLKRKHNIEIPLPFFFLFSKLQLIQLKLLNICMFTLNISTIQNLTNSRDAIVIILLFFICPYIQLPKIQSQLFFAILQALLFHSSTEDLVCQCFWLSLVSCGDIASCQCDIWSCLISLTSPTNDGSGNCSEMKLRLDSTETLSVIVRHRRGWPSRVLRSH